MNPQLRHEIEWLAPENLRACGLPLSKLEARQKATKRHFSFEVVGLLCSSAFKITERL
jgi:hypothetical protein